MAYAYIFCIVDVLPDPIVGRHLAIGAVLGTYVVASVISLHPGHLAFVWRDGPSHMNGCHHVVRREVTGFVSDDEYSQCMH